jgi:hypothetical protein
MPSGWNSEARDEFPFVIEQTEDETVAAKAREAGQTSRRTMTGMRRR